jgi:hypothetical protein
MASNTVASSASMFMPVLAGTASQLTKLQTCPAYNTSTRTTQKIPLPTALLLLCYAAVARTV